MRIPLREPLSPRYIYINKGIIHLMVPVVGGQEISTDNTCRARLALKDFFEGGALQELNAYKDALIFDIALLEAGNPLRIEKEGRLTQIEAYISAASSMQSGSEHAPMSYNNAINAYLAKPSNLYSIQLRPRYQDSFSIVINPAFSLERKNDATGTPLSALYNAMQDIFPSTEIALQDPRSVLTTAVLEALPESPGFKKIRKVLTQKCKELFNQDIDFTSYFRRVGDKAFKQMVDQNHINELLRCGPTNPATPEENIDALLDTCALRMWVTIPANTSFFIAFQTTSLLI